MTRSSVRFQIPSQTGRYWENILYLIFLLCRLSSLHICAEEPLEIKDQCITCASCHSPGFQPALFWHIFQTFCLHLANLRIGSTLFCNPDGTRTYITEPRKTYLTYPRFTRIWSTQALVQTTQAKDGQRFFCLELSSPSLPTPGMLPIMVHPMLSNASKPIQEESGASQIDQGGRISMDHDSGAIVSVSASFAWQLTSSVGWAAGCGSPETWKTWEGGQAGRQMA